MAWFGATLESLREMHKAGSVELEVNEGQRQPRRRPEAKRVAAARSERACEIQPTLKIALMSTDPDGHDAELLGGYPEFRALQKPVTFERLYGLLGSLVGPPEGLRRRCYSPRRHQDPHE